MWHVSRRTISYTYEFKKHALPLFLEGYVHAMRVAGSTQEARHLYNEVRKSELFDKKLKIYAPHKLKEEFINNREDILSKSKLPVDKYHKTFGFNPHLKVWVCIGFVTPKTLCFWVCSRIL